MFYNIKSLKNIWMERKKGVILHSLSRTTQRSGAADERVKKMR